MFKEAPEVLYTGLSKNIGEPRDYQKNSEDPQYFASDIDTSIPVEDTNEYIKMTESL